MTYDLRLGISGHRDLRDEVRTAHRVARLLDGISATLDRQDVVPVRWTVVSALARGADRLFADAVLTRDEGRLEVVTPFPVDDYVHDFEAGQDREEFDRLFAQASRVDQLPIPGSDRRAGYLRAGEHVVDTCEILVAIWDGRQSPGGGTGDVVEYAVRHGRVVVWLDADSPEAPPCLIRSVTYGEDGRVGADGCEVFPHHSRTLSPGYYQQTRYCLDAAVSAATCAAEVTARLDTLVKAARAAGLDPDILRPEVQQGLQEFVRADALAGYYQRRYKGLVSGVLYLAAAAVTVAVGQVVFFPGRPQLIVLEIVAMLLVLGLWWWGTRQAWHEQWLYDRHLAERLRAAMFMRLLGAVALPLEPLRDFVISQWLEHQRDHHAHRATGMTRAVHRRHQLGFGLFWATLVMATLHFAGVGHPDDVADPGLRRVDSWITFLALVLPAWAGAIHGVTSELELERLAQRSAAMAQVLEHAVHRARTASTIDELRELCSNAGELMADENHEWRVLLSFQRPRLHV